MSDSTRVRMFTRLRRLFKADHQLTIAQQRREAERQAQIADMRRRQIRAEQEQDALQQDTKR